MADRPRQKVCRMDHASEYSDELVSAEAAVRVRYGIASAPALPGRVPGPRGGRRDIPGGLSPAWRTRLRATSAARTWPTATAPPTACCTTSGSAITDKT